MKQAFKEFNEGNFWAKDDKLILVDLLTCYERVFLKEVLGLVVACDFLFKDSFAAPQDKLQKKVRLVGRTNPTVTLEDLERTNIDFNNRMSKWSYW